MLNLEKLIEELEEALGYLLSLPSTVIAYYDDLYGYPWGRIKLIGILCLGFSFWFAVLNLLLQH
jgi:hypothetical protein